MSRNRKRPLLNVAPPRPKEFSQLEKILVAAAGAETLPWSEITFTLRAGLVPLIKIECFATHEDLAAAVAVAQALEVRNES